MNISRREFLAGAGAMALASGCCCNCGKAKVAVQLYSIRDYIKKVGLEKALADVAKIGYSGVEFAGYYNFKAKELKKMLDDNGLVACGTHVGRTMFAPDKFKETCEFNLEFGNSFICCPGGGNRPDGYKWNSTEPIKDDWWKFLVDFYNCAAQDCATMGCKIGLHNHQWEFQHKLANGQLMWDYFFSNTDKRVQMEQDVGWTTCAGFDPCEQYRKYPGRSFTLHAKENGMGKDVTSFDAILGQPGKPGAKGVDWDKLFPVTDADGVKWYVVECEKHSDKLLAIEESFKFLRSKGRC